MRNKNAKVSDPSSFVSCPGSPERSVYSAKINEYGVIEVTPVGKENYQEYIESFRSQTDISYILNQLSLGNTDVLRRGEPVYGDYSQMPKSLADAMQLQIDAERDFLKLPIDVRNSFNNNVMEWILTFGSDTWKDKMHLNEKKGEEAEALVAE